ncbi:PREDICTED: myozenin-3 [Condylura cristata]|uniref:myozenin-3 n=1 Tax=Condylura cristata TaxID=143302 RepID=UPI0003343BE9|nr:PREDICTED: myozenin-3 [Condylura cristata]
MIPKEQKGPEMAAVGDLAGQVPLLDLGKKLSVPQDLMMEELSLRNSSNPGSLLFQRRQRRVQKFTFELASSQQSITSGSGSGSQSAQGMVVTGAEQMGTAANGPKGQNCPSDGHILQASPGGPELDPSTAAGAECAPSSSTLAPGYAEPLKSVPPEKFNHTAIPKGYRCPWQESGSSWDRQSLGRSLTPRLADYRNFNKTPMPFGGPLAGEAMPKTGTLFLQEFTSGLELLRLRPNFNRVAQGWVRNLPESEEL